MSGVEENDDHDAPQPITTRKPLQPAWISLYQAAMEYLAAADHAFGQGARRAQLYF